MLLEVNGICIAVRILFYEEKEKNGGIDEGRMMKLEIGSGSRLTWGWDWSCYIGIVVGDPKMWMEI